MNTHEPTAGIGPPRRVTPDYITLIDDTGRQTSLATNHSRKAGFLVVVGVLPHCTGFRPATTDDALALVEWCLKSIGAQPSSNAAFEAMQSALTDCIECLTRLPNVEGAYRVTCISQARAALALNQTTPQKETL